MNRSAFFLLLMLAASSGASAQNIEAGKAVYAQCRACHQIGEGAKNLVGPHLNGIFGRTAGTVPGFLYSSSNKQFGKAWDESTFTAYIKDPKAFMPGTKMVFVGLKDDKKIADLIAYLKSFAGDGKSAK
jgi:cytochrome c